MTEPEGPRRAAAVHEWGRLGPPALIVHGGAGRRTPERIDAAMQDALREAVSAALVAGCTALSSGGDAVTAVVEAVAAMEESGVFNAGRGSVRTSAGTVEMDAAVMDGTARAAGAVAAVSEVRHPVRAARAVLDDDWVLLAGHEADRYAAAGGCETVAPDWFAATPLARTSATAPPAAGPSGTDPSRGASRTCDTVGAVAVDRDGRSAAATSTGGVPGQIPGRVGDSPIVGAGLWADDRTCAVSASGIGEAFLRAVAAHHVHLLVRSAGASLPDATRSALDEVEAAGGFGGMIVLSPSGDHAVMSTTPLFIRGFAGSDREPTVRLFAGA